MWAYSYGGNAKLAVELASYYIWHYLSSPSSILPPQQIKMQIQINKHKTNGCG